MLTYLFISVFIFFFFFFFNDTPTTEIYTLSLHDALPISPVTGWPATPSQGRATTLPPPRSEEHTSELQSRGHLVCRLLLEKKNTLSHPPLQQHHKKTHHKTQAHTQ